MLADGTIIDCASTLRKDNTGYDIKQLFIGSEGTLGIITKVVLLTPPKPQVCRRRLFSEVSDPTQAVNVAFFGLRTFEDVKKLFTRTKQELGEILSGGPMMHPLNLYILSSHCFYAFIVPLSDISHLFVSFLFHYEYVQSTRLIASEIVSRTFLTFYIITYTSYVEYRLQ